MLFRSRIPLLRQRIQKERASLEQSLTARAKDEVDSVREGLQGLREVRRSADKAIGGLTRRNRHAMLSKGSRRE